MKVAPPREDMFTGGDTYLMTPLPRTVYGPDDWEDATPEQWLEATGTT